MLIDLKMKPFKPADAGQMNFYLNWMKEQEGRRTRTAVRRKAAREAGARAALDYPRDARARVTRCRMTTPHGDALRSPPRAFATRTAERCVPSGIGTLRHPMEWPLVLDLVEIQPIPAAFAA